MNAIPATTCSKCQTANNSFACDELSIGSFIGAGEGMGANASPGACSFDWLAVVIGPRLRKLACLVLLSMAATPCWAQSEAADKWQQQIVTQINLHKYFPPAACGKSGEAKVGFILDRTGQLISAEIVSGTGNKVLDEAALETVKRAQPFPAAPPEVSSLKFIAPIVFRPTGSSSEEMKKDCEALRSEMRSKAIVRSICRGC